MNTIAVDFETWYDKDCTVKKLGSWAYTRHPDFYAYLIAVYDGKEKHVCHPRDFNWDALKGAHLLSHNAFFDRNVYEAGVEKNLYPKIDWHAWTCTSNMTAALCNRRSLKDAMQFLFGEEISKDARTNMQGVHWADVENTKQGADFLAYAGDDAVNCWRIHDKFGHCWSPFERELFDLTIEQSIRGVQIDVPKLKQYLEDAKRSLHKIECQMPWVLEGEKPTGTKAIAMLCREVGIPTPPVKSHENGEEKHEEWLKRYSEKYPWVDCISQHRSLNKFIASLETIDRRLRPDGTFSFAMIYAGAHTLRWSSREGLNMQNMRRDPVLVDNTGLLRNSNAAVTEYWAKRDEGTRPEWLAHEFDVRSLFIPRPGYKFVLCDLAQIEPRVLAWCAQDEKMLTAIRDGFGVYEAAAVATGKYSGQKGGFKKMKALYQAQKAQTLALGYGCGWEKYIAAAMDMAQYDVCQYDDIDPVTGRKIYGSAAKKEVYGWREANPLVAGENGLWKSLDEAFKASIGSDFVLELPSGRSICYRNVQRRRKKKTIKIYDNDHNVIETKIEERWSYTAEIDGRRYDIYGGILTENLCQAIARDVFGYHLLLLKPQLKAVNGFTVWSAHDESINEIPIDVDSSFIQKTHSITPPWLPGCPIAAEAKEAQCYLK